MATPVVPYECRRNLVPQACALCARPSRSYRSYTKVGQLACREEAQMYQTKHDLPAHTRAEVIEILNARLADSMDRNGAV